MRNYYFDPSNAEAGKLYDYCLKISKHNTNVLILGETGVGKEVIADFIQSHSNRAGKPFVKINCAAIPETLIEAELFGYERGAFTGAAERKTGKLELANHGTFLLDEIGDMPVYLQTRLLRVTEKKSFNRVGGNDEISVDVRFIAATHTNIEHAIENGRFRSDLFYRLSGAIVVLPPLRQRKSEIVAIANFILEKIKHENSSNVHGFSEDAVDAILSHTWPGNFREIENRIKSGMIKCDGVHIRAKDMFDGRVEETKSDNTEWVKYLHDLNLERIERAVVCEALARKKWVQKEAAALLGITPRTINFKIVEHGIKYEGWKVNR